MHATLKTPLIVRQTLSWHILFLKIIYTITSQNIDLSSWITVYIFTKHWWRSRFMMLFMHTSFRDEIHRSKIGRLLCVMDHYLIHHMVSTSSLFALPIKQWECKKWKTSVKIFCVPKNVASGYMWAIISPDKYMYLVYESYLSARKHAVPAGTRKYSQIRTPENKCIFRLHFKD